MIEELKQFVGDPNFKPFSIGMSSGEVFKVPSRDHIMLTRTMAIVKNDQGLVNLLAYLHMARLLTSDADVEGFAEPTSEPPASR